jgi:hypothetical protein
VLEVVVLGHGCGLTTCRKEVLHLLQPALQTSLPPTQESRTVRLEEVSVPSKSLPGSHEAIDHVSRLGHGTGLAIVLGIGDGGVGCGVVIGVFARRGGIVESTGWPRRGGIVFVL